MVEDSQQLLLLITKLGIFKKCITFKIESKFFHVIREKNSFHLICRCTQTSTSFCMRGKTERKSLDARRRKEEEKTHAAIFHKH
jgi:hypothetical protein